MLKKKYEYYVRLDSKLILVIDSDIVEYLKNKLDVDGNIRDEVYNVLRNERETQLFKLALWVNNDYYNTVHPNGFCLLFSSLACKQKLCVSVSKKRRRDENFSSYDIRKKDSSTFKPRKELFDILNRETEVNNEAKQNIRPYQNKKKKVSKAKVAEEEEIAKRDRADLLQHIESILASNKSRKILLYDTIVKLEIMKYLINHGIPKVYTSAWLTTDEFEGIMKLCGLKHDYAFFREIGFSETENKDFIESCQDQGYLWLSYKFSHFFTFSDILKRVQSSTTVIYRGAHSWLHPNVELEELEELFNALVDLVHDVYRHQNLNASSNSEFGKKKNMERGVVVSEESVSRYNAPIVVHDSDLEVDCNNKADASTTIDPSLFQLLERENDSSDPTPAEVRRLKVRPIKVRPIQVVEIPAETLSQVEAIGEKNHLYFKIVDDKRHKRQRCSVCKKHLTSFACASCYYYKKKVKYVCTERYIFHDFTRVLTEWNICKCNHENSQDSSKKDYLI